MLSPGESAYPLHTRTQLIDHVQAVLGHYRRRPDLNLSGGRSVTHMCTRFKAERHTRLNDHVAGQDIEMPLIGRSGIDRSYSMHRGESVNDWYAVPVAGIRDDLFHRLNYVPKALTCPKVGSAIVHDLVRDGRDDAERRALAAIATCTGGVVLARALTDEALVESLLAACRESVARELGERD